MSAGWGQHGVGDGISEKWITRARAGPTERRSVRAGLHMPLAAYYDSSADRGRQVVTLTGVAARCVIWESFERNWLGVLKSYSVPALHMNKLMHFRGDFKAENGWNERRRSQFLGELWNVIGSFRMQHLVAYSCSVLTDDWFSRKERSTFIGLAGINVREFLRWRPSFAHRVPGGEQARSVVL